VVLLASTSRVAWAAAPAATAERPLRVTLDVSALAEVDAPHIERFTLERIEPLLQKRMYTRADDAGDAIEIRFDYLDQKDLEYAVYVDVYEDGALVEPGIAWFVCKFCPQSMLADNVAEHLPAALDLLERAEVEAVTPMVPEERDSQTTGAPIGSVDEPTVRTKPIGGLGITAAVVAGGGLATTIAGAVEFGRGEVVKRSDTPNLRVEDHRPQGVFLLSVGMSALVLGTAVMVVDVVTREKNKKIAVAPSWMPRGAGVSVSVRF